MVRLIKDMNRYLRAGIALFLAVCMFGIGPMQDLSSAGVKAATASETGSDETGENTNTEPDTDEGQSSDETTDVSESEDTSGALYISEIRYFHGDKGKKRAESEGWILHDTDLNSGNDGGSLWLAYKTTTDRNQAITALKTMEMKGGYELTNYRKLMETTSKGLGDTASAIITTAAEFKENLDEGYVAAAASKGLLNLFTLKEGGIREGETVDDDKLLGNYLAGGKYKNEDIQELLMQINPTMLSTILTRLAGGVFFREVNFAGKVPEMSQKLAKMSAQAQRTIDTRYRSTVLEMKEQLQKFSRDVRQAKERTLATDGKILLSDGSAVRVDVDASGTEGGEAQKIDFEEMKELADKYAAEGGLAEKGKQGDEDLALLSYLNVLNRYMYDDSTKLGNKLVELGELQMNKLSELRQVYPLVMAMTPGQTAIVKLCGVTIMTEGLIENDEIYRNLETKIQDLKGELASRGYVAAPVWSVEDRSFYEGDIAYTKKLIRANAAGAAFTDVTKTTAIGEFWNEFTAASDMISSIAGLIFAIASFCLGTVKPTVVIATGATMIAKAYAAGVISGIIKGGLAIIGGIAGFVGLAILAICFLVWLGKKIYNAIQEWDDYSYSEKDIPKYLLDADETDTGEMANIRYYLVDDPDEDRGDLNCREGKRWNALYYTRSVEAGDPICAYQEDDFFRSVFKDATEQPAGFEPVCSFHSPSVQAINDYAEDKDNGYHYLYYRTSLNGDSGTIAKGRAEKSNGEYLADIRIFSGETETEAKAALRRDGYRLYDVNISTTGDSGRKYSYLGYKVTNKKLAAIRDIRVCIGYPGTSLKIGDISYSPGQGDDEHTANNAFICHTTSKDYGSPISWKNVFFITDRSQAKPGWEPVSLTCGGPAFNWRDYDDYIHFSSDNYADKIKDLSKNALYMYYKPDEVYTDGEEYLSGIQIISGTSDLKDAGSLLNRYMNELGVKQIARVGYDVGWTLDDSDFSEYDEIYGRQDLSSGRYDNYDIWLAYTTTHNPYRAITDVKLYRTDYTANGLTPQLVVGGKGYTACENYQQIISRRDKIGFRYYAPDRVIIGSRVDGARFSANHYAKLKMYERRNTRGKSCDNRGLYVSGYQKDVTPMKPSDMAVRNTPSTLRGYRPIEEFLNAYDYSDKDIGFINKNGQGDHVYIYVRGEAGKKSPKYIKNIIGTYFETPMDYEVEGKKKEYTDGQKKMYDDIAPEQCRLQALQMGAGEMLMTNCTGNPSKSNAVDGVQQYFCYLGIVRTDNEDEAMRGVLKYWLGGSDIEKKGMSSVKVGGVKYQLSGMTVRDSGGDVYAYYTTSQIGAGTPILEVSYDEMPFKEGCDTMLAASTEDTGSRSKQVFADTKLTDKEKLFLHLKRSDGEKNYFSRIVVGKGDSELAAQCDLLSKGCNRCIPLDMNKFYNINNYADYVMIGARTCSVDSPDIAIRDILCTVGEEPQESFMRDGYEYMLAGDVSLNQGAAHGKKIYLYYSHGIKVVNADEYDELVVEKTEPENTPTTTDEEDDFGDWLDENDSFEDEYRIVYMDQAPITQLAASEQDFLPKDISGVRWEKILDTNGNRVNAEDGLVFRDKNLVARDNRIYLFTAHEDGKVKSGAAVTETDGSYMMSIYYLYLKRR